MVVHRGICVNRSVSSLGYKEAISGGVTQIILVTRSGKEPIGNHFNAHYELEHRLEKKCNETILGKLKT